MSRRADDEAAELPQAGLDLLERQLTVHRSIHPKVSPPGDLLPPPTTSSAAALAARAKPAHLREQATGQPSQPERDAPGAAAAADPTAMGNRSTVPADPM